MFIGLLGLDTVTGDVEPLFDNFNSSTADIFPLLVEVFLFSSNFLKSIKLVFGVPNRSEHVVDELCGTSTLFDDQLCRERELCCGSNDIFGVDRPELIGEFPCERIPLDNLNFIRKSSVNDAFMGDIVICDCDGGNCCFCV
jgi:hypothetical protein